MSQTMDLLLTPLHGWHASHGGRMVDFAGWSMPVLYDSIVREHQATRQVVGLFDISHMGRLDLAGPEAGPFLDRLVSRRVTNLAVGRIRYALVCNPAGGVLDDILVYRLADSASLEAPSYRIVVNASNRAKIVDWLEEHNRGGATRIVDTTQQTAMIALQGPQALALLAPQIDVDLAAMKYYTGQPAHCDGVACYVSRTGYTGEDGLELMIAADQAVALWQTIYEKAIAIGGRAAGLGCRDTLRLEAGMPLYGHELTEEISPWEAGLANSVDLADRDFVGHSSLATQSREALPRVRVGLELDGRRVPRAGSLVLAAGNEIGTVTSGTFSPTFERPIAMAYIQPTAASVGDQVSVDIRGQLYDARVVPLPFYRRGDGSG